MLELKCKNSENIKTLSETYTVKSIIQVNPNKINLNQYNLIWYRQPPGQYQIEELIFNSNQHSYKCTNLDYQCTIVCKIIDEKNIQIERFDFGPIQKYFYNQLSTNLEIRVQISLFNSIKKCIFDLNSVPTLINPLNNNKYELTTQDLKSIYLKPAQLQKTQKSQNQGESILNSRKNYILVINNLFQRLILLKLFHEIPNGMYCYSMELLQISFYDESSCNAASLAINRFRYKKKEVHQISKSMFTIQSQNGFSVSKYMKKSNESLAQFENKSNFNKISNPKLQLSLQTQGKLDVKIQPFVFSTPAKFRKSPKQSINSAKQSILSINSISTLKNFPSSENKSMLKNNPSNSQLQSNGDKQPAKELIHVKAPKISILSTQITSIKGGRQQKSSFPQTPSNLKSSELLKPKEFRSPLSLRRSQDDLKTPRLDTQQSLAPQTLNQKKKSCSSIQKFKQQQQKQYVNEFENLLYEENEEIQQMCLNDSFAKLQQEQQKQDTVMDLGLNFQTGVFLNQNLLRTVCPSSPTKSQRTLCSLKEILLGVLKDNHNLSKRNQTLKRQIEGLSSRSGQKQQRLSYQTEIQNLLKIQQILKSEIQKLKSDSFGQRFMGGSPRQSQAGIGQKQKFLRLGQDPQYQKFRANQSYSYKATQFGQGKYEKIKY